MWLVSVGRCSPTGDPNSRRRRLGLVGWCRCEDVSHGGGEIREVRVGSHGNINIDRWVGDETTDEICFEGLVGVAPACCENQGETTAHARSPLIDGNRCIGEAPHVGCLA